MARCRICSADNPDRNCFCGACGAALGSGSEIPTVAMPRGKTVAPSGSFDEGRFPPGTVLAERYRIVGLLGTGGMGEVYRANDLKLGQPVALKFLSAATSGNHDLLARFHAEVRIARQVSHPNVCRVYDIGEVDGSTFLSMEYVDGEDLQSLLRRIGRLPGDKALEIARRLCAGLAAAHDKGVLHRDLKPANIMIDGRGQVLIADFGLAALAGQLAGAGVRDGTPAYMAPEQLSGKEVSVRSDIYALGLVLYEMFTGKRAFESGSARTTPTAVTSSAKDIDPLVERVILRCLDLDPRNRPASAIAVAAALPGGDPLAAALAAGDTPTPGMVAASGDTEGIPLRTAGMALAWILVAMAVAVVLSVRTNILEQTPFPNSPEIQAQKAREMIRSFGYAARPADSAGEFTYDDAYRIWAEKQLKPTAYRDQLEKGQPPLIVYWYRQSPQPLVAASRDGAVSPSDPPPLISGMIGLHLDPQGRLLQFDAVPSQEDDISPPVSTMTGGDWNILFAAAGLDMNRFSLAEPQRISLAPFDSRAAWIGSYPDAAEIPLRIEAASWHGRPVMFRLIGPWSAPERMPSTGTGLGATFELVMLALGVFFAWRNLRANRTDIRGANKTAALVFAAAWLAGFLGAHHTSLAYEAKVFLSRSIDAVLPAALVWVLYLAFEPYVRRRWPQSMISWSRVLNGGFRDPLVGGHVLFGVALGMGLALEHAGFLLVVERFGIVAIDIGGYSTKLNLRFDARGLADALVSSFISRFITGMALTFALMLLRVLLRRQWLAAVAFVLMGALSAVGIPHPEIVVFSEILFYSLFAVTLLRFGGLLPTIICLFVGHTLGGYPFPISDFSTWYASTTVFILVILFALTAYAFYTAVAGRPLFKAGFFDPD